jgi:NADPH:quinone reductase-like Zn-dependent oxidoreductase/NAD(P)-dependent dehydrogenase (short-subunit alcohol dehydrogenase family)/acyl carrier protein
VEVATPADIERIIAADCGIAIELGGRSTLGQSVARRGVKVVGLFQRGQSERLSLLRALATLHTQGAPLAWTAIYGQALRPVVLPSYPWQRQHYWIDESRRRLTTTGDEIAANPLLGRVLSSPALRQYVAESDLSVAALPWLGDHVVQGQAILPLAAFLEIAMAAVTGSRSIENVSIERPFEIPASKGRRTQIVSDGDSWEIFAAEGERWTRYASGQYGPSRQARLGESLASVRETMHGASSVERFYDRMRSVGINFGSAFQTVRELYVNHGTALARLRLTGDAAPYRFHPALLDGCLQGLAAAGDDGSLRLPVSLETFRLYGVPGVEVWAHAQVREAKGDLVGSLRMWNTEGELIAEVEGVHLRRVLLAQPAVRTDWLHQMQWRPKPLAGVATRTHGRLLVIAAATDQHEIAPRIATALRAHGAICEIANANEPVDIARHSGVVYLGDPATNDPLSSARECATLARLADVLVNRIGAVPRLWIVTRGAEAVNGNRGIAPFQTPLRGLARTIALEQPELRCTRVDLDPSGGIDGLIDEITRPDDEDQIAWRGGIRYVARLAPCVGATAEPVPARLAISTPGMLDCLEYMPAERRMPEAGEIEIRIFFAALNFRDVLNALGTRTDSDALGSECAGVVESVGPGVTEFAAGDFVVAIAPGGFGTFLTTAAMLAAHCPAQLRLAEAVTMPLAFLTARLALEQTGHLKAGDRVLIHAGAGGVGLAAIQLARRAGAEIFATAGSEAKREWLRTRGATHIFSSRDASFREGISRATGGRGVDIALNSLTGDLVPAGLESMAPGGIFLEIGKADIWERERVRALRPDIRFEVLDWAEVARSRPEQAGRMLREVMADAQARLIEPLPFEVYARVETESAFRNMAQGIHRGKLVVQQSPAPVSIGPLSIREDGIYLITGGLSGLGLRVAEWLVERGARRLMLLGRSEPDATARAIIGKLEAAGATVWARHADVSSRDELEAVFREIDRTGLRLRGVVHSAGVLDDGLLGQQDEERMARVFGPKVAGAWHLEELSRGRKLDLFVLFSSLASVLGSAGQANHAAANAFLDGLAHWRRGRGEHAVSIQWGAWGEIGSATAAALRQRREGKGIGEMSPAQGIALLEEVLRRDLTEVAAGPVDWAVFTREASGGRAPWLSDMLSGESAESVEAGKHVTAELARQLEAAPAAQRKDILRAYVRAEAGRILGMEPRRIDVRRPLSELGLDSLMSVELRNTLATALGRRLQATILFKFPTVEALTKYLLPDTEVISVPDDVADLLAISDEEAEELLASELESRG